MKAKGKSLKGHLLLASTLARPALLPGTHAPTAQIGCSAKDAAATRVPLPQLFPIALGLNCRIGHGQFSFSLFTYSKVLHS